MENRLRMFPTDRITLRHHDCQPQAGRFDGSPGIPGEGRRIMKLVSRRLKIGLLASAGMLAAGGSLAFADQLIYATNEEGGQLYKVDVTTNSVTTLVNTGANPDSLVFSGSNILFTEVIQGNLSLFNTTTDTISNV